MSSNFEVHVDVDGAAAALAAFRRLPDDGDRALSQATRDIATALAGRVAADARSDSPQSALMAGTVRVLPGPLPGIAAGGSASVGSRGTPAYKILFGSIFGARTLPQFRPHLGTRSYWFLSTVYRNETVISRELQGAADRVVDAFEHGGR
ncbi:hypothetical protein K1W54_28770 [Micromonospora sp. CPCC 205371]|nr:hypothetical protein [Micromonospora sp. CPCC 205371]